jgi:hypothetical protein
MSEDLSSFFQLIAEEKKKKDEEFKSVIGELNLDGIFEEVSTLKKKNKENKKKIEKQIEVFENFLYSEAVENKLDDQKVSDKIDEIIEDFVEDLQNPDPIEEDEIVEETLIEKSLGLLAEPSNEKIQTDPLTPLTQNFATLDDLQRHYRLFLERIQQQLSTVGGGGETKLKYLDDVVGIATNSGAYDGKYLQWNSATNRAEFTDPSDAETTTIVSVTGITTYYQATNTDDYIGVSADVPVEIRLPTSPIVGKKITVKDEGNKISLHNITVTVGAGVSVENDISVVMKINHQSFTFFYNNQNWFLV